MSNLPLRATTFVLYDTSPSRKGLDIWAELAEDVCDEEDSRFQAMSGKPYRLQINGSDDYSPDRRFVRFRTINVAIRLKQGFPALLDVSCGNWLFAVGNLKQNLPTFDIPDSRWVRGTTAIRLEEQLRLIHEFVLNLEDAGWQLEPAPLVPLDLESPKIETGSGVRRYDPSLVSRFAATPLWQPAVRLGILVLDNPSTGADVANRLAQAWQRMFRWTPVVTAQLKEPLPELHAATLVVIPDQVDLAQRPDLRELLHIWEMEGRIFKLARRSTTTKPYPLNNLCFDLSLIAGSLAWRPVEEAVPAVSVDAGHDTVQRRSRWASARINGDLQLSSLRAIDTELAEHLPSQVVSAFWPTDANSMVVRDGRLARERQALDSRALAEGRLLWEVKKSPTALLFRGEMQTPKSAQFPDAVIDPHGEVLLQTLTQGDGDCIHPVRIALSGNSATIQHCLPALLTHCAAPMLSMYQQSRLPGPVYWADLASKLDRAGWSQVIGRGCGLADVIPR